MDALVDRLALGAIHDQALRALLDGALLRFYAFTLVLVRMSGLMIVGPIFGQAIVPVNVRVLLIIALSLLITPALGDHSRIVFNKLDANRDGQVTRDEVPNSLAPQFASLQKAAGKPPVMGLSAEEFHVSVRMARSLLDYLWIAAGELGLGFVLGLGVMTILSGLQLAGQIVDQQTGLALGEIASPGLNITGSVTGQFLFLFATTVLLVMQPTGYHLSIVSALVETFQSIPLGEALVAVPAVDLLRDLVHQSLVIGIQVAAPILATMSLVALTMGFLGHSVPQINVLIVGFPVRGLISLAVLIASLSGIARRVVDAVPPVIDALRLALAG